MSLVLKEIQTKSYTMSSLFWHVAPRRRRTKLSTAPLRMPQNLQN